MPIYFLGKSLRLGGSKELYKENATVYGDPLCHTDRQYAFLGRIQ